MSVAADENRKNDADAGTSQDASRPDVTDAAADVGVTADLAEVERLEDERALRESRREPDLPDRAFDRITPQV